MTTVINLYGGPGSGKSTLAAGLFYQLKMNEINAELVREYVKMWAWENRLPNKYDQIYLTGKQAKYEYSLYGKVDYIVTDSPLYLCPFYENKYYKTNIVRPSINEFMKSTHLDVNRKHYFVKRLKSYNPKGRFCSEEEAIKSDTEILNELKELNIEFKIVTSLKDIINDLNLNIKEY